MKLLSREEFKKQVFERQNNKCAFCEKPCEDAHHILERKLFDDGGYYLSNGIGVCSDHHWDLEIDEISVKEAREALNSKDLILPPGFSSNKVYDKWGNEVINEYERIKGTLFLDDGCQKALKLKLWMFK